MTFVKSQFDFEVYRLGSLLKVERYCQTTTEGAALSKQTESIFEILFRLTY